MKRLLSILPMICLAANAANVKISDLPIIASPSTNTLIEVADMNEATKSRSYLLTNLATVADMLVASNTVKAASQATNSVLTQWASIPTNSFVLKSGDTMTGDLTTPGIIVAGVRWQSPQLVNTSTGAVTMALITNLNTTYVKSGLDFPLYLTGNGATNRVDGGLVWVQATYIGTNWFLKY